MFQQLKFWADLLSLEISFGPHFQVVGKKYVRLYSASLLEELHPYSETMLCNSSQVTASLLHSTKQKLSLMNRLIL